MRPKEPDQANSPARRTPLECLTVKRPRCPACGSSELRYYRTERTGHVLIRYTRCQCGHRFKLLLV